jgi:hypothetical protein
MGVVVARDDAAGGVEDAARGESFCAPRKASIAKFSSIC